MQFFDINNEVVDAWKTDTIPEWKENSQYIVGDVFVYDNVYYRVLLNFVSTGAFDDSNLAIMSQSEIDTLLEPFNDIYERAPSFQGNAFTYKYTDGMHRDISVSVNKDVQTTMGLLSACPK